MNHGKRYECLADLNDDELHKRLDKEREIIKKKLEQKNKDAQKYREYLRKHGYSEKDLAHFKFEKLREAYNNTREEIKEKFVREDEAAEKLEALKLKFGGMCGYLLEKGMKPDMVESWIKLQWNQFITT